MHKIFFSLILLFTSLNLLAYNKNGLIDSSYVPNGIKMVDIGKNESITNQNSKLEKILTEVEGVISIVSRDIIPIMREEVSSECIIDTYGHEACPLKTEQCQTNTSFSDGFSTHHDGEVTAPLKKVTISSPMINGGSHVCVDHIAAIYLKKDGNKLKAMLNAKYWTYTNCPSNYGGSSNWQHEIASMNLTPEQAEAIDKDPDAFKVTLNYSGSCLGRGTVVAGIGTKNQAWTRGACSASGAQTPYVSVHSAKINGTTEICPDGYFSNGGICKKTYNYYTYSCPTDVNQWGEGWQGPLISTGGDCMGNGVAESSGGTCPNSGSIPPKNNCQKFSYSCPVNSGTNECVLDPNSIDTNATVDYDGYIFKIPDSTKFEGILTTHLSCPDSAIQTYECETGWELYETNKCKTKAIESTDSNCVEFNNKCYKNFDNVQVILEGDEVFYIKDAIQSYNEQIGGCISDFNKKCADSTQVYDSESGSCIRRPECDIIGEDGECYKKPEIECPKNFIFNSVSNKCEADVICSTGRLSEELDSNGNITKVCRKPLEDCQTSGFELNRDVIGKCSKELETEQPICPNTGEVALNNICNETVEYSKWTIGDFIFSGGNQHWTEIVDQGGPAMFQSVNTFGVYLYPKELDTFSLSGKIRVGVGCGGNGTWKDNDIIGITFGYKDKDNFWALGWVKAYDIGARLYNGSSDTGLHLVKVINGKKYLLANLPGSYGWSCTTVYTEFKITNSDDGVKVFKDGNLVIDYKGGHAPKGKAGYLMYSQGEGYYKDFTLYQLPKCKTPGYIYDPGQNICYKDYGNDKFYDLTNFIVMEEPSCSTGIIDNVTGECVLNSVCSSDNASKVYIPNRGPICESNKIETCTNGYRYTTTKTLEDTNGICMSNNPCFDNETPIQTANGTQCANNNLIYTCPDGFVNVSNFGEQKCIAPLTCPKGFVNRNNQCELKYFWYEYQCPSDYEISDEVYHGIGYKSGADCKGSCGKDGCFCNSEISPPNSCKKKISTTNSTTYSLKKRLMKKHRIIGETLSEKYMNLKLNKICSDDPTKCMDSLIEVTGNGTDLCFKKRNGESSCFQAEGCYFNGNIINPEGINNLYLEDPYTLVTDGSLPERVFAIDQSTLIFDSPNNKGIDYCNYVPSQTQFSQFSGCPRAGITPDILALKLSDGNWYIKRTGSLRCGENAGNFHYLEDSAYTILPSVNSRLKIKVKIPDNLTLVAISDIESVANIEFGASACNSDNAYDEDYLIYPEGHSELAINIKRTGRGVLGSKTMEIDTNIFNGPPLPIVNKIESTCKMNGYVGWSKRENPIVSIGNTDKEGYITTFYATGYGSEDNNLTHWTNFNAGTMAVQFNDSEWYIMANLKSTSGENIEINKPVFVKELPASYYIIKDSNVTINSKCVINGKQLPSGICGDSITILSPQYGMKVTAIAPVKELFKEFNPTSSFNNESIYNIVFKNSARTDSLTYGKIENPNNKAVFPSGVTVLKKENAFAKLFNSRLRFWDPYQDYDIGYIEFVPEVYEKDRAEGYVPEDQLWGSLLLEGFTSIKTLNDNDAFLSDNEKLSINTTYFVKPSYRGTVTCQEYSNKFGLPIVDPNSFNVIESEKIYKKMGFRIPGVCILSAQGLHIPSSTVYSIKKEVWNGPRKFVCSPYSCQEHICKEENCVEDTTGTLLPESYDNSFACKDQSCDGFKDYIPFCGKVGNCPENSIEDSDRNCKVKNCPENSFLEDGKCKEYKCPQGTIENDDGSCTRN